MTFLRSSGPGTCGVGLAIALAVLSVMPSITGLHAQAAPVFFLENWESGLGNSFNSRFYGNTTASQFSLQQSVRASGASALEHRLIGGASVDYATQHFADARQTPLLPAMAGAHLMDVYVQYKVYYSANWDLSQVPKQLIIGTEDVRRHENVCCNPWVAHYITIFPPFGDDRNAEANNKQAPSGQWIGFRQNASGYNSANRFVMQRARWYTVEVRRRLNDSGDNGIFQMWIDGVLMFNYTNVRFRTPWDGNLGSDFAYGTNFIMISDYVGNGVSSQTQSVFYDDIRMSTAYMGTGVPPTVLPAAPRNLRIIPGQSF